MRKSIKTNDTTLEDVYTSSDRGITLVALIITIIILVILAAVSIAVVYKSKVVGYATESSQDYAQESLVENKIMEGTTSLLDSTVDRIGDILGGNGGTGNNSSGNGSSGGNTPPEAPEPVPEGKTESE